MTERDRTRPVRSCSLFPSNWVICAQLYSEINQVNTFLASWQSANLCLTAKQPEPVPQSLPSVAFGLPYLLLFAVGRVLQSNQFLLYQGLRNDGHDLGQRGCEVQSLIVGEHLVQRRLPSLSARVKKFLCRITSCLQELRLQSLVLNDCSVEKEA